MKALVCASALWLACAGLVSAADTFPCVPALDELVKARLDLVEARQQQELVQGNVALFNNGWLSRFFYDRISGTSSYGRGLTIDSKVDGNTGHTLVQTNNTHSTWTITYTLPLNAFTEMRMANAKAAADRAVLQAKQKLERQDEATKISVQYGDFLEAKAKLLSECSTASANDDDCLTLVFKVRKAAAGLLCLAGKETPKSCTEWDVLPEKYAGYLRADLFCVASLN
jgi:hypothetical protein